MRRSDDRVIARRPRGPYERQRRRPLENPRREDQIGQAERVIRVQVGRERPRQLRRGERLDARAAPPPPRACTTPTPKSTR